MLQIYFYSACPLFLSVLRQHPWLQPGTQNDADRLARHTVVAACSGQEKGDDRLVRVYESGAYRHAAGAAGRAFRFVVIE